MTRVCVYQKNKAGSQGTTKRNQRVSARTCDDSPSESQDLRKSNVNETKLHQKQPVAHRKPNQQLTKNNWRPSPLPPLMASTILEDTTPSAYKSRVWRALGRAWQGRCVVSWHCYRNDPEGLCSPCDSVDTECCYQDVQWNKPKSHAYTQEKNY